jgi:hypothetical protein
MRPSFFLPLLVLAAPVLASSAVLMDVPALTRAASDVVRARALSTRCAWTEDHRRLVTFVEVEVLEAWKGRAPARLTVLQPGGEREGIGQRVAGVAPLEVGEEVVLFLERQGPLHRVVGLSQGVYRVVRGAEGQAARAVPADVRGLALVSAPGRAVEPRAPVLLEGLRQSVRQEVRRE